MKRRTCLDVIAAALLLTSASLFAADEAAPRPAKDLPKVFIIGDSISIGYTPHVTEMLKEQAEVSRNRGNAQHTGTGLQQIDTWLGTTKWDVIHFNWGLHDLCYRDMNSKKKAALDKAKGTLTTTLDQYEKNLEQLVLRLKTTGAVLIWAHTTVVPAGEIGRIEGDHKKYNDAATRVMKKHGVMINDLQALTEEFEPELFLKPANVHYKPEGYKKLAEQVAEKIREALKSTGK
jgi:lysophospholipase L1-like esterase